MFTNTFHAKQVVRLGRLDALNGRPKDYMPMDIRTPEYPQIFDFMIISLFVVDLTQICGVITALFNISNALSWWISPRFAGQSQCIHKQHFRDKGGSHPDLRGNHSRYLFGEDTIKVDLTPICGAITACI